RLAEVVFLGRLGIVASSGSIGTSQAAIGRVDIHRINDGIEDGFSLAGTRSHFIFQAVDGGDVNQGSDTTSQFPFRIVNWGGGGEDDTLGAILRLNAQAQIMDGPASCQRLRQRPVFAPQWPVGIGPPTTIFWNIKVGRFANRYTPDHPGSFVRGGDG